MRVLVTGADGFAGRHVVELLVQADHEVWAGCRPGGEPAKRWLGQKAQKAVTVIPLEITDPTSVSAALGRPFEAIVHLAAVASGSEARQDPGRAWVVNAAGTARLVDAAATLRGKTGVDPLMLVVSSAEVYGNGPAAPRVETDPLAPQSPYAASKVGTEVAALEAWRREGLRVVIARAFPHTGPGQLPLYVVPAFLERLRAARATGAVEVRTGSLDPVRDLLDVRDVAAAYVALLGQGSPGEAYNVARGAGVTLRELFGRLADMVGAKVTPVPDPSLMRPGDIQYLVGDAGKLRRATGWSPGFTLEQTLREMVDAQAH
ncbi:MAG TPA: GDP-mannose 4,6-dehydratase [Gemmatimonadales bacterium]|jgi:GDP-4-dehydro-6-deoxy-D-mannose reductase